MTKGAARIGERRFGCPPWIQPGALNAGDIAVDIGDGSKQRRPGFQRSIAGFRWGRPRCAIVDRRVIAQGGSVEPTGDATGAQIGLGRCAGNGASCMKQALRRSGRAARCWWHMAEIRRRCDRGTRQGEKAARFVHRFAKAVQIAVETDQIEQIAMLAGRGIGLMYNCT